MSNSPAHSDSKERERPATGIAAALRQKEPGAAQGAVDHAPYVSRGLPGPKAEPERQPAEADRPRAADLYRAHEAAHDPAADRDGFVSPSSFALSLFGAPPLRPAHGGEGPQDVPGGGPAVWARRTGAAAGEVGPPPAHPLSVVSPLGIGVAGGAWNAPSPGQGQRPISSGAEGLGAPAGNLQAGAGATLHGGPSGGGEGRGPAALREETGNLRRGAGNAVRDGAAALSRGGGVGVGVAQAIDNIWHGLWQG